MVSNLRACRFLNLKRCQRFLPQPSQIEVSAKTNIADSCPKSFFRILWRLAIHSRNTFDLKRAIRGKKKENVLGIQKSRAKSILSISIKLLGLHTWWPKLNDLLLFGYFLRWSFWSWRTFPWKPFTQVANLKRCRACLRLDRYFWLLVQRWPSTCLWWSRDRLFYGLWWGWWPEFNFPSTWAYLQ